MLVQWEKANGSKRTPAIEKAHARLAEMDSARRAAGRTQKAWKHILATVSQHSPDAAKALKKLAASPSDGSALTEVGAHLLNAASARPELRSALGTIGPMLTDLFTDKDGDE